MLGYKIENIYVEVGVRGVMGLNIYIFVKGLNVISRYGEVIKDLEKMRRYENGLLI